MKNKLNRWEMLLVLIMLLSLFTACISPSTEVTSYPIEITDQLGRVVKLDRIPQKIISL